MGDFPLRKAAGLTRYASTDPGFFLFAGEAENPTGRAQAKQGVKLPIFSWLALDADGTLIAWDPNGTLTNASGTVTFNGQPAANDTVTINGTAITFVAGAASAGQVSIGANVASTAAAFRDYVNATAALPVSASGAGTTVTLTAETAGTGGNALTLAKSGTNLAVSGATLAGGTTGTAADQPSAKLVGLSAEPIDTTSSGTNAITFYPYYEAGIFNHQVPNWPAGLDTLPRRKAALAGTRFSVDYLP